MYTIVVRDTTWEVFGILDRMMRDAQSNSTILTWKCLKTLTVSQLKPWSTRLGSALVICFATLILRIRIPVAIVVMDFQYLSSVCSRKSAHVKKKFELNANG
ncbi:hypothetical protein F8388_022500 [Cannabis sativa]|uniref:Uncharacterized protein n=1 Tax=Cannabis sativa TaxID=3483 RepID=A0A7J6EWN5_CANSA|nr:hypothetical protein F8388_022500 [Cannabis sativa]